MCVFDQISNLQNTPQTKPRRGGGSLTDKHLRAKYLFWSICKNSQHLGFNVFIDIWSMVSAL
jgi:hypothetical protein